MLENGQGVVNNEPRKLSNQCGLGLRSCSGSSKGGVGVFNSSASVCGEVEDPFEVVV